MIVTFVACEEAEQEMKKMRNQLDVFKGETDRILREKEITNDKVNRLQENNVRQKEGELSMFGLVGRSSTSTNIGGRKINIH